MLVGLQTLAPLPESWQHQRGGEVQRQSALWFGQHRQLRPLEQDGQAAVRKPLQCSHHGELCGWAVWYLEMAVSSSKYTWYKSLLIPKSIFMSVSWIVNYVVFVLPLKAITACAKKNIWFCHRVQDESHFLKNMKTARCKAALPLLKVLLFLRLLPFV